MAEKKHYAAIALQYCKDVVSGKIDACNYIRQGCQRHIDDLKRSKKDKSYPYEFDEFKAFRVCHFVENLTHTKGEWAFKKMRITLEPWQVFNFACVFGWVRRDDGLRRFVEVYDEIPRKNGKSVIAAGVGLYCFAADNEFGAEVYSGATTEKQAWEVFRPARLMAQRNPALTSHFGIQVNASNLLKPADGARFEPLIGNPGDGSSPSCAIVDEYHEHDNDALFTTMLTGMGARRQPIMWIITTAGYNIAGPCYEKRREAIEMLSGTTPNDRLFAMIYTIDDEDEWTNPSALRKANPNMGVSVFEQYLLDQLERAKNNPNFANKFKTKHLNRWTSAKSTYYNMENWKKCSDESLNINDFLSDELYSGLDLARKLDLNSLINLAVRMIDGRRHYYCLAPKFWVPEDTVFDLDNKRMSERYQNWVNTGDLIPTDGAEVDYRYIFESIKEVNATVPISGIAIDPHGATGLSHMLIDETLNVITMQQNYTKMSDPMKELEAAIESGRFHHDGNPILTWCMSNVIGKNLPGNDDVVRPVKENADSKIDGAVALIMAMALAMTIEPAEIGKGGLEWYDDDDIVFF